MKGEEDTGNIKPEGWIIYGGWELARGAWRRGHRQGVVGHIRTKLNDI